MKWLSAFFLSATLLLSGLQLCIAGESSGTTAEKTPAEQAFVRLKRDENGKPATLQVAVVRHVPRDKDKDHSLEYVDLISAVYICEHDYYKLINFLFTRYDAVLYELVAPQGTRIPGGATRRKVSFPERRAGCVLGMGMQLEDVDYTLPHLVHADLSPSEFSERMDERNESVIGMIGKAGLAGMGRRNTTRILLSEMRLLRNLMSGNRDLALKIFRCQPWRAKRRLVDPSSREVALLTRRAHSARGEAK